MEGHSFDSLNRVLEDRGPVSPVLVGFRLPSTAAAIGKTAAQSCSPAPFSSLILSPAPLPTTPTSQPSTPPSPLSSPRPAAAAFRPSRCLTVVSIASLVHQARLFDEDLGEPEEPVRQPIPAPPPVETTTSRKFKPKHSQGLPSHSTVSEASCQEDVNHPELGKDLNSLSYIAPTPGPTLEPTQAPAPAPAPQLKPAETKPEPEPEPKPAAPRPIPISGLIKTDASDKPQRLNEQKPLSAPKAPATVAVTVGATTFTSSFSSFVQAAVTSVRVPAMGFTGENRTRPSNGLGGGGGMFGGWLNAKGANSQGSVASDESAGSGAVPNSEPSIVEPMRPAQQAAVEAAPHIPTTTAASTTITTTTTAQKFLTFTRLHSAKEAFTSSVFSSATPSTASLRSSASSVVDGSSRPTTPQKQNLTPAVMSPARTAASSLALKAAQPPHPALVNEFEGLNFDRLITSFLPPTIPDVISDAASDDTDVIVSQAHLEELANTAKDLLDRVYTAYSKRTKALEEALAEQGVLQEEVEEGKAKARHLKSQLQRLDEQYKKDFKEKDEVIGDLIKTLETEKVKIQEEKNKWEDERKSWEEKERERLKQEIIAEIMSEGTIIPTPADDHDEENEEGEEDEEEHGGDNEDIHRTPRKKRTSLGAESSDSGFDESDNDGHCSSNEQAPNTHIQQLQQHSHEGVVRKASLSSIRTSATSALPRKKADNMTRRGTVIRMVPPPVLSGSSLCTGFAYIFRCLPNSHIWFSHPYISYTSQPPPLSYTFVQEAFRSLRCSSNPYRWIVTCIEMGFWCTERQ
ncbi:hypothetical protein DFH27DRAFT_599485 [Peziza echinospora]|nr:hypothetical protein DFH27DRAFT_599485 [Peziza echinospora]